MLEHALLYFIPNHPRHPRQARARARTSGRNDIAEGGEFLKIQPGTGDNLSPKDIAEGYTDYVIWNRFRPECLDIDGELPMECVDSGMVLLKGDIHDVLGKVLNYAYGQNVPGAIPLLW